MCTVITYYLFDRLKKRPDEEVPAHPPPPPSSHLPRKEKRSAEEDDDGDHLVQGRIARSNSMPMVRLRKDGRSGAEQR